jgi:hypothetical protein
MVEKTFAHIPTSASGFTSKQASSTGQAQAAIYPFAGAK